MIETGVFESDQAGLQPRQKRLPKVSIFQDNFDEDQSVSLLHCGHLSGPNGAFGSIGSKTTVIDSIYEEDELALVGEVVNDDLELNATATVTKSLSISKIWYLMVRLLAILTASSSLLHTTLIIGLGRYPMMVASDIAVDNNINQRLQSRLWKRENSPTDVCQRWSGQSAVVNGTLYVYGGRASTSSGQKSNTWNNYFITIDLTKSWQISSPQISGLPQPSGPDPVSLGYLWNSYDSLFLYGGEFSDSPTQLPTPFSLWEYNIKSKSWIEHKNPKTSAGKASEPAGVAIERAAEGAGCSVAALGRGWMFGGHLDFLTTAGWSNQIPRQYLRSFVEFTFPGYSNDGVDSLNGGKTAGSEGAWRNITKAGIQDQAGFTERADGLLLYIPGFGPEGILLSLAGGIEETFTQMNEVDVYDIASSTWYRQATSGPNPKIRVNPCAVVASAADGTSHQVYMYGGQNLQPAGNQTQYSDMWILSIPSFTWIPVDTSKQSTPYGRAGHSCNIWDGQMVVVGGYTGPDLTCESPGIYVFNCSSLQWVNTFTALTTGGNRKSNPFSQQLSQVGSSIRDGLEGSYGYSVPEVVYKVIGGSHAGGATVTAPVASASDGPLASGSPITYTVTGGGVPTSTSTDGSSSASGGRKTNVGATVAGVLAGVLFLTALYFAFCAFVYRKQLQIHKHHSDLAAASAAESRDSGQRYRPWQRDSGQTFIGGIMAKPASWFQGAGNKEMTEGSSSFHVRNNHSGSYGGASNSASNGIGATSVDDLLGGMEPSYWGVLLHPRRSLRIVNQ